MLRKQLERLEAQAAQLAPDGEDPPPGGGGGGGDGGGAGGKAAKDRERVRPDPPTPPDSDADSSEDDVGGGGHRGPPRLGGGVGRDDAVGELFGGHVLACDYDSDNPFERKRGLQQRTSHYSPAAAGDTVHAELHRKLGAANQREVCTLLPSLSYMYDLCAHLERLEDAIGDERDDPGDSRRALRLVHEQVRAARLQAGSILAFGQERLDELESVGKGALEAAESTHSTAMSGRRAAPAPCSDSGSTSLACPAATPASAAQSPPPTCPAQAQARRLVQAARPPGRRRRR